MNIAEILKDCPEGTKLYSLVHGEVYFISIRDNIYPITVKDYKGCHMCFTSDGRLYANYDGECMLFPSKENRDWSTFKDKRYCFKPFDKVLVRYDRECVWRASLFSNYRNNDGNFEYITVSGSYEYCIPYEGNEHLLGTNKCI